VFRKGWGTGGRCVRKGRGKGREGSSRSGGRGWCERRSVVCKAESECHKVSPDENSGRTRRTHVDSLQKKAVPCSLLESPPVSRSRGCLFVHWSSYCRPDLAHLVASTGEPPPLRCPPPLLARASRPAIFALVLLSFFFACRESISGPTRRRAEGGSGRRLPRKRRTRRRRRRKGGRVAMSEECCAEREASSTARRWRRRRRRGGRRGWRKVHGERRRRGRKGREGAGGTE
jgi:hypothetical protein